MRTKERIPIHDHSDRDSGGLVAASTIVQLAGGGEFSGSSGSVSAAQVPVADVAGNFTGENVEDVLAEIPGIVSPAAISALGFVGELLISDDPSTPLVFADILQNDDEDDLLYADL